MSNHFIELGAISMLLKEQIAVVTGGGPEERPGHSEDYFKTDSEQLFKQM